MTEELEQQRQQVAVCVAQAAVYAKTCSQQLLLHRRWC